MSVERKRGCGFRKAGAMYLMAGKPEAPCGKLPLELKVCVSCGQGIRPSRAPTWIQPPKLFGENTGCKLGPDRCFGCPCGMAMPERALLIWIGESHYPTPDAFMFEARQMGISRRITVVPRGFVVGESWVFFAHRKAIYLGERVRGESGESEILPYHEARGELARRSAANETKLKMESVYLPGVITACKPDRIEKVFDKKPSAEEVEALEKRKIEAVVVVRLGEDGELFDKEGDDNGKGDS